MSVGFELHAKTLWGPITTTQMGLILTLTWASNGLLLTPYFKMWADNDNDNEDIRE